MAWDDTPPTAAELQATAPAVQTPVASTVTPSADWASTPPSSDELQKSSPTPFQSMGDNKVNELLKTGFNFDTYQKMTPDEKKQYGDLSAQHAAVFQNAAKLGASSGLTLGFKKDLLNSPKDLEDAKSALPADQQTLAGKESSAGQVAGNLVGGAPLALATGGATAAATKGIATAADLGPLATRGVQALGNIGTAGALGEAQGIANSNAPTLAGKAQEALPSAALGAGLGLGAEALANAPQVAQAISGKVQPAVQGLANKFAFNSLKPTAADVAKANASPGLKNQIGQYLNDNQLVTPFSNQADIAQNIQGAKQAAGQQIGSSTQALDEAAAQQFTKPGADVPSINPTAMEGIKPNQPTDTQSAGYDIQDEPAALQKIETASSEAPSPQSLTESTGIQQPAQNLQSRFIGRQPGLAGTGSLTGGLGDTKSTSLNYVPTGNTATAEVTSSAADIPAMNNPQVTDTDSLQTLGGVTNINTANQIPTGPASDNIARQTTTFQTPGSPSIIPVEKTTASPAVNPQVEQAIAQKIAEQPLSVQQQVQQILNPSKMADELEAKVITPLAKAGDAANVTPVIQEQLSKFSSIQDPTLSNLFQYRQQLDTAINFNKNPLTGAETPVSKALKVFRGEVDNKLMNAAKQIDDLTDAGAYDALVQAKKDYSSASTAGNIAQRSAAQQESGLAKTAIPAAGAAVGKGLALAAGSSGGIIPAAAGAGAAYVGKKYGNQFAATSLNQLSSLLKSAPETLGEFAAPLQSAAGRGTTALSAMNFALYSSNPQYRQKIDQLQDAGEQAAGSQ